MPTKFEEGPAEFASQEIVRAKRGDVEICDCRKHALKILDEEQKLAMDQPVCDKAILAMKFICKNFAPSETPFAWAKAVKHLKLIYQNSQQSKPSQKRCSCMQEDFPIYEYQKDIPHQAILNADGRDDDFPKICSACGTPAEIGDNFCTRCGKKFEDFPACEH